MLNHQKLLSLYNDLDETLRKYYSDTNYSNSCIMRYIKELDRSAIEEYREIGKRLDMIRVLRNDLIHQFDMNETNLIEVTDETISFLSSIVNRAKTPVSAKDIMTPLAKLQYIVEGDINARIEPIVAEMRKQGHTNLPILATNKSVIGVFTPNVLFDYLNAYDRKLDEIKISDMKNFYPVDKHFSESYKFINKFCNVVDIANIFYEATENNLKLSMIFVTDHGKPNEPLLGVIVLKDLLSSKAF